MSNHTPLWSLVDFLNDKKLPLDIWKDTEPKTQYILWLVNLPRATIVVNICVIGALNIPS